MICSVAQEPLHRGYDDMHTEYSRIRDQKTACVLGNVFVPARRTTYPETELPIIISRKWAFQDEDKRYTRVCMHMNEC